VVLTHAIDEVFEFVKGRWGRKTTRASHNASAAFTITMAVLWLPVPTVSLMEGGSLIKNMKRNRSLLALQ
jgi:hypothetical protein